MAAHAVTLQLKPPFGADAGGSRRKVCRTRNEARADMFDYIEMFDNPTRKPARNGMLSTVEIEPHHETPTDGVRKTRGYSQQGGMRVLN